MFVRVRTAHTVSTVVLTVLAMLAIQSGLGLLQPAHADTPPAVVCSAGEKPAKAIASLASQMEAQAAWMGQQIAAGRKGFTLTPVFGEPNVLVLCAY
jgi:hypothetical protein